VLPQLALRGPTSNGREGRKDGRVGQGRKREAVIRGREHTHIPFNGPLSRTTWMSRYQKGKTDPDFTEARDSEWHWHQLGHMQVYTSLQTDIHTSTPPLCFLQAGCLSCHPTNSVKALRALGRGREGRGKRGENQTGTFLSSTSSSE